MQINIMKNTSEAAISLLISVALIDNHYSEEEEILILKLASSYNYPSNKIEELKNQILEMDDNKFDICEKFIEQIEEQNLREKLIEDISNLIASDHIRHENEIFVYKQIAQKWGMYQSK